MRIKTFKELRLKDSTVIPQGTILDIFPHPDKKLSTTISITKFNGIDRNLHYHAVKKCPSIKVMHEWSFDGIGKSIAGKRVEPDGYDSLGFPCWLLAMGYI